MTENAEVWFTVEEAADHARHKPGTIRRWLKEGLKSLREGKGPGGGKHLIARSDLDSFLRARLEAQAASQPPSEPQPPAGGEAA